MATIPSRKATFTEAGQIGKDIRSKLGSAVKAAGSGAKWAYNYINDFVTEYGQEPLLNLYPQAVNLFAAGGEVAAGMADKPVNLGRFPYYDLKTQFDKRASSEAPAIGTPTIDTPAIEAPAIETPAIETPKERKEAETITETKKDASPQKLWRVMLQGGNASEDTFYDNEDDARKALAAMGGKGAVAGIRFPAKSREEESALKEQYMQQAAIGGNVAMVPKTGETEEERITRKISEVNPNATPEQKARFLETLSKSRARGRERGGYAEEYNAALAQGRTPTAYEERVMGEEARGRRMEDFAARNLAKEAAREKEKSFQNEYKYLRQLERTARRSRQPAIALEAKRQLEDLSGILGSSATNVSARRRLFEKEAMDSINREIQARDRFRRERLRKTITSNPEAETFDRDLI